jgi:hypothetical protein
MLAGAQMLHFIKPGQSLFKFISPASSYFDATIQDFFVHHRFHLNSPEGFNDPFDTAPAVKSNFDSTSVQQQWSALSKDPWSNKNLTTDQIAKILLLKETGVDLKTTAAKLNPNILRSAVELKRNVGVSCFTERADNLLLWSHYAGQHSGFCVEFLRRNSESSGLRFAARVSYADQRPAIELSTVMAAFRESREGSAPEAERIKQQYINAQFFTKSSDWSYEQEWRIALTRMAGTYLSFDASEVKAVFLGARSSEETQAKIKNALSSSVPLYKMRLHEDDYKVLPVELVDDRRS